jgi:single-strand DNA-binding protein
MIAGHLTRDPELRYTPAGTAVCRLGIAATRYFKGRDGEKKEDTTFVDVTAWEKTAEYCGQNLRQGRPILVEGELRSSSWEDKTTGQKRSKLEIHAIRIQELAWSESRGSAAAAGAAGPAPSTAKPEPRPLEEPIPEDDIPF